MLVELVSDALEERNISLAAVLLFVGLPKVALGVFKPSRQVWRVKGQLAVVMGGGGGVVEPAVGAKDLADLSFEGRFELNAHGLRDGANAG